MITTAAKNEEERFLDTVYFLHAYRPTHYSASEIWRELKGSPISEDEATSFQIEIDRWAELRSCYEVRGNLFELRKSERGLFYLLDVHSKEYAA